MDKTMRASLSGSTDVRRIIDTSREVLPLQWELSLVPLIRFWTEKFADDGSPKSALAAVVRREIENHPELAGPLEDCSDCAKHAELLHALMAVVLAPASFEQEYAAALVPFQLRSFYATTPASRLLLDREGYLQGRVNLDERVLAVARLFTAYKLILQRVYGIKVDAELPIIITVPDPDTGLERHFKATFDYRFVDVTTVGEPPALGDEVIRRLRATLLDRDLLLGTLPPEKFHFRGFTIFRAVDVTEQEVLSSIKRDLIDKESIVSTIKFQELQAKLRTLLRRPEVNLGLAAITGDEVLVINYGARTEMVDAVNALLEHAGSNGSVMIDEAAIARHLYTRDVPDPDLLIRTSGEMRLSNFLLWQVAYAEIWVTETFWPDFQQENLFQAIIDFQKRERRYGGLGPGLVSQ